MRVTIDNMNIAQIADSGQCFRWNRLEDGSYEIIAYDRYLKISQNGNEFDLNCEEEQWEEIWSTYLDTDTDYAGIGVNIERSDDTYLKEAYKYGQGIRILRQDLWETLISFIISQNNNIKRIKGSIEAICAKAALPLMGDAPAGKYRFPRPYELDREFFNDRNLGLGYRDGYLADMYEYAAADPDFPERLKTMDNEEALHELKSFKGIGDKVANCVCLFGLHHIDAFPIDTHIKQILKLHYQDGFDFERYKGYAGIIQQYMFNYKLNSKGM
ncbi:MAG: 8-oxoguanine DNA glycosylase [Lachnospiraceae bacterium]|nr:8-oxoguanine DNA glycosylase [Lachnospiraceae bacterium]